MDILAIVLIIVLAIAAAIFIYSRLRRSRRSADREAPPAPTSSSGYGSPDSFGGFLDEEKTTVSSGDEEYPEPAKVSEESPAPPPPLPPPQQPFRPSTPAPAPEPEMAEESEEGLYSSRRRVPGKGAPVDIIDIDTEAPLEIPDFKRTIRDKEFSDEEEVKEEAGEEIAISDEGTSPVPGTDAPTTGVLMEEDSATEPEPVQFSAYYPREIVRMDWQPLTAYVFRAAFAAVIKADARKQLGADISEMREVVEDAQQAVKEGALITATPVMPGFQFNPPTISIGFYEDWHRLDFKLRATEDAPLNLAANGALTFTVEGVIVADIPLSIFVGDGKTRIKADVVTTTVKPYPAIFASYSHDDINIVECVERAYRALGMDYLRDVHTLKSGQDWDDQLLTLIENADIFQLFWSNTAADSPYVRKEWEHALGLGRDENAFIRPVYWEMPMPGVPDELEHIHFAYQPNLGE